MNHNLCLLSSQNESWQILQKLNDPAEGLTCPSNDDDIECIYHEHGYYFGQTCDKSSELHNLLYCCIQSLLIMNALISIGQILIRAALICDFFSNKVKDASKVSVFGLMPNARLILTCWWNGIWANRCRKF